MGETIEFTVTTNVDYDLIPSDWIKEVPKSRAIEWETNTHRYIIDRNVGNRRTGTILVKENSDDEKKISAEVLVTQSAGEYESGESNFGEDIIVPIAGGEAYNNLGVITAQPSTPYEKIWDGKSLAPAVVGCVIIVMSLKLRKQKPIRLRKHGH